ARNLDGNGGTLVARQVAIARTHIHPLEGFVGAGEPTAGAQAVEECKQQGRGAGLASQGWGRLAPGVTCPNTHRVATIAADGPGVAQAIAGAGFPGDTLASGKIAPEGIVAGARCFDHGLQAEPGGALADNTRIPLRHLALETAYARHITD